MKKQFLFFAVAALALASCSSDKIAEEKQDVQQQQTAEPNAVTFDAYTQRGVTRAGQVGMMTTEKLRLPEANGGGFGVFGYYTDNNDYEQSRVPDYMYNQLVKWNGNYWEYAPIKYWPNEYGNNAMSDDADKVTFFAYAPYVKTNASGKIERTTGDDLASYGITGISRNSNQGDPIVKYIASFEADKSVDLLWGIVGAGEAAGWALTNGGSQSFDAGYPWMNVMRPAEAATQQAAQQRLKFTFAHALTQLTMKIDAIVDEISKGSNTLADGTKIYVRQLSMTGVALKGALNLNNTEAGKGKALWLDYNGLSDIESGVPVVLYDGRKDGKEGVQGATASNEKIVGFNEDIISNDNNTSGGVTATPKQVFRDDPVMLIPTGENMELEIIYDVETTDPMLPTLLSDGKTNGSSIENKVRKTINFPENGIANGLENGKHYTINLHLGMNSVKFDVAQIEEWVEETRKPDADLPSNSMSGGSVAAISAARDASLSNFTVFKGLAYNTTEYRFAISGLTPSESIKSEVVSASYVDAIRTTTAATVKVGSSPDYSGTDNKADASGVAYVKVTLPGNPNVHNLLETENYILIEGESSLKGWKARFNQAAHPFGLQVKTLANSGSGEKDEITLEAASSGVSTNALKVDGINPVNKSCGAPTGHEADFVKMSVNNMPLTNGTATGNYSYSDGKITYYGHLNVGDVVTITVAAHNGTEEDGAKETVTFTVGGISFAAPQTITYQTGTQDPLVPTWVGKAAPTGYTYTAEGTPDFFSITSNEITTSNNGTTVGNASQYVKCVATFATPVAGDAYFYTTTSCTATYDLTVNEQATSTAFTNATQVITGVAIDATSITWDDAVTVKDASDNSISVTKGTQLKYYLDKVELDGSVLTGAPFSLSVAGALTCTAELTNAKNYKLTIRAEYDNTTNTGYATSSATKVITVQTVGF